MKVGPLLASFVETSPSNGVELDPLSILDTLPAGASMQDREETAHEALLVIMEEWILVKHNFELLNREL
jgi:hypothetical protein